MLQTRLLLKNKSGSSTLPMAFANKSESIWALQRHPSRLDSPQSHPNTAAENLSPCRIAWLVPAFQT
jgi:hypothetical protein